MAANVGNVDRAVRIVLGLLVLSLYFVLEGNDRWWALIGLPLVGTGLIRWCPAYLPFNIDTR